MKKRNLIELKQLIVTIFAVSIIIVSVTFIVKMAPFQGPPRQNTPWLLGYMSVYCMGKSGNNIRILLVNYSDQERWI
jgi:hypothetical protein